MFILKKHKGRNRRKENHPILHLLEGTQSFVPGDQCACVLSPFVHLLAIPWTVACQAPLSMGFSRQEYWSGLPFSSPMRESEVAQLRLTLSDPMDCSLPGSSIHGIFQARVLEWGAIAFSQGIGLN